MKLEVYKSKGMWRWRIKARNGRVLAVSSEGYTQKRHCERMAMRCSNLSALKDVVYLPVPTGGCR